MRAQFESPNQQGPQPSVPARRRRSTWSKRLYIWWFMAPGVVLVLLVTFYPTWYAFNLSLHETFFTERVRFVGLDHYRLFLTDPTARSNLLRSLIYVGGTVAVTLPLALLLAVALNAKLPMITVFRAIIFLPWVLSEMVIALLWRWLLDQAYGPVNYALDTLVGSTVSFLGNDPHAMYTLIAANSWRLFPLATILLIAALQTIPSELYESASIDGASGLQRFASITMPLISSTLMISLILITIYTFNMVTLIYMLTGGGPFGTTDVLAYRVYREAFENWSLGYAATMGMIIFLVNAVLSLLYMWILRRDTGE